MAAALDQKLTCKDCGVLFDFPPRDQDYYRENQWDPPVRCKPCRVTNKKLREEAAQRRAAGNVPDYEKRRSGMRENRKEDYGQVWRDGNRRERDGNRKR